MRVAKNVFMLNGVGYDCNVYLIDKELMVDTGTGTFFSELSEEINNLGCKLKNITKIVNTHCHFDHAGASKKFRDATGAELFIHRNEAKVVEAGDGEETLSDYFGEKFVATTVNRSLKDGDVISTENYNFQVIHTPGHSSGSICLYDKKSRILISGDTLFADGVGRTDFPGGNQEVLMDSIKHLSENQISILLPGHGMFLNSGVNHLIKSVLARSKVSERKVV